MFAKAPRAGQVKTRLAATLGQDTAAEVYSLFLQYLLARLSSLGYYKTLAFWPAGQVACFADFAAQGWQIEPQCQGDLGTRMCQFFRAGFAADSGQVVLIGSDSPDLPLETIHAAFLHLESSEVVLGPSHDGGYYLIGMSAFHPQLFDDIPWSSPQVFDETVAKLHRHGTSHTILDPWYDVDDEDDLHHLLARLEQDTAQTPRSLEFRQRLTRLLQPHH